MLFQCKQACEDLQREQRDFVNPRAKKRRLNRNAVPSKFSWTPVKEEEEEDVKRTAVSKLERRRIEQNEATDTASEGEGDELRVSFFPGVVLAFLGV